MSKWNDVDGNLAGDYFQAAGDFIWAAEKLCNSVKESTTEYIFKLENPASFLIGHAIELLLKAGLARVGVFNASSKDSNLSHKHDLELLLEKSLEQQIPVTDDLRSAIVLLNEDFKHFVYRYPRIFAGFPDSEQERLNKLIGDPNPESKKELRKYGLQARNSVNLKHFITIIKTQLEQTNTWLDEFNSSIAKNI